MVEAKFRVVFKLSQGQLAFKFCLGFCLITNSPIKNPRVFDPCTWRVQFAFDMFDAFPLPSPNHLQSRAAKWVGHCLVIGWRKKASKKGNSSLFANSKAFPLRWLALVSPTHIQFSASICSSSLFSYCPLFKLHVCVFVSASAYQVSFQGLFF